MKYTPVILREILRSLIRKLGEAPEQFVSPARQKNLCKSRQAIIKKREGN